MNGQKPTRGFLGLLKDNTQRLKGNSNLADDAIRFRNELEHRFHIALNFIFVGCR
jgi:hypothetical protein